MLQLTRGKEMCPFTSLAREDMRNQSTRDDARPKPYGLRWQVRRDTAFAREGRTPILTTSGVSNSVFFNRLSPSTSHLSFQESGGPLKKPKSPPNRAKHRQSAPNRATMKAKPTANRPKPPNRATNLAVFGGPVVARPSRLRVQAASRRLWCSKAGSAGILPAFSREPARCRRSQGDMKRPRFRIGQE